MIACNTEQLEGMVYRCENCPGFQALQTFLRNKFTEMDIDDEVSNSQWKSTDRTSLRTNVSTFDEFTELLLYSVSNLTTHSFIAKSQARYLKSRKVNNDEPTCIILLDFAENYHVVQDQTQGYNWNKEQCSLHPMVIYYKDDNNELHDKSICISADLEHDTSFVYQLQKIVTKCISEKTRERPNTIAWCCGGNC